MRRAPCCIAAIPGDAHRAASPMADPTPAAGGPHRDALEAALTAILEASPAERPARLAALCREHPSLTDELGRQLGALVRFGLLPGEPTDDPAAAPTVWAPAWQPQRLGPFELGRRLGGGGMGVVHEAVDERTGRRVAVKLVRPELLPFAETRARFQREVAVLAGLDHPALVPVLQYGEDHGVPWYAMPLVAGRTLAATLAECQDREPRRLPPGLLGRPDSRDYVHAACEQVRSIALALAHAHAQGIVHRDVKPSNLMLAGDGRLLLIDFGLAHAAHGESLTRTGVQPGSLAYMAPEQVRGEPVDARSDVFSLGCVLYELLALRSPFAADTEERIRQNVLAAEPPPLRSLHPGLPRDVVAICATAMAPEPSRRYGSAKAFADDLDNFLRAQPIAASPAGPLLRLRRFARRRPALTTAVAMGLLLTTGLPTGLYVSERNAAERERELRHSADAEATRARAAESRATARQREFDQLKGVVLHERAMAAERSLYPALPHRAADLEGWLRTHAAPLLAMRNDLQQTLADLRTRAAGDPAAAQPRFTDTAQQFLFDTLGELDQQLAAFATGPVPDVQRRLRWANEVAAASLAHPLARVGWDEARRAIRAADGSTAHVAYRGRDLPLADDQILGLVPIGCNPDTLLWEFYDLRSAWDGVADPRTLEIPMHVERDGRRGHIEVGEATGIVFVLLPGGRFHMGAQAKDPLGPNFDPDAGANEGPVHEVELAPFFLARHEVTQAQWRRLTNGQTPSNARPGSSDFVGGTITWAHPVEQVDWPTASSTMLQHGLRLPTEAQSEYAQRGGTQTPWWTGRDRDSLRGVANMADGTAKKAGAEWTEIQEWPQYEDGYMVHAPVDALRPNAFGLHHVHGNVWEWCADWFGPYTLPTRPGDGMREVPPGSTPSRVPRSGAFTSGARAARSAYRRDYTPTLRYLSLGLRAARSLDSP